MSDRSGSGQVAGVIAGPSRGQGATGPFCFGTSGGALDTEPWIARETCRATRQHHPIIVRGNRAADAEADEVATTREPTRADRRDAAGSDEDADRRR
jgi:hypothetical protein